MLTTCYSRAILASSSQTICLVTPMNRIKVLDGWRGIAILLVLFDHVQDSLLGHYIRPWTRTGVHGVTIFFVLSGYLITSKLLQEQIDRGISLKAFYIRRFFRLMPGRVAVFGYALLTCKIDSYSHYIDSGSALVHFLRTKLCTSFGRSGRAFLVAVDRRAVLYDLARSFDLARMEKRKMVCSRTRARMRFLSHCGLVFCQQVPRRSLDSISRGCFVDRMFACTLTYR